MAKGDTVTYRGLTGGVDFDYRVGRGEVKENIVLNRAPSGPVSFTFAPKAGGLTHRQRKDGSIGLYGGSEWGRPTGYWGTQRGTRNGPAPHRRNGRWCLSLGSLRRDTAFLNRMPDCRQPLNLGAVPAVQS